MPGPRQNRVFTAGREQHRLLRRPLRIWISVAQTHALRQRDENAQLDANPWARRTVGAASPPHE